MECDGCIIGGTFIKSAAKEKKKNCVDTHFKTKYQLFHECVIMKHFVLMLLVDAILREEKFGAFTSNRNFPTLYKKGLSATIIM